MCGRKARWMQPLINRYDGTSWDDLSNVEDGYEGAGFVNPCKWKRFWLCRAGHSSKKSLHFRQWNGDSPLHHVPIFFHLSSIIPAWWQVPWNCGYSQRQQAASQLQFYVVGVQSQNWSGWGFLGRLVCSVLQGRHWPHLYFLDTVLFLSGPGHMERFLSSMNFIGRRGFFIFWDNKMQAEVEFYKLS